MRGAGGWATDVLVIGMTRAPASNGPGTRTSEQVPAVQSTTSAQNDSWRHAVCANRARSLQAFVLSTLQVAAGSLVGVARPHATALVPQVPPFTSRLAVLPQASRRVPPPTASFTTRFAQRR